MVEEKHEGGGEESSKTGLTYAYKGSSEKLLREDSQIDVSTHNVRWTLWGVGGFGTGRKRFKNRFFSRSNH